MLLLPKVKFQVHAYLGSAYQVASPPLSADNPGCGLPSCDPHSPAVLTACLGFRIESPDAIRFDHS